MAQKKTPGSKLSFSEAIGEVEAIVTRLENEEIDIDELSAEVRRAVELSTACRETLQSTDGEVRELVARLQDDTAPAAAADTATDDA